MDGLLTTKSHLKLVKVYKKSASLFSTANKWAGEFKLGWISLEDNNNVNDWKDGNKFEYEQWSSTVNEISKLSYSRLKSGKFVW